MKIDEQILLIITAVITTLSALFCLISLATPGWYNGRSLFCKFCPQAPAALSIIALILLIIAILILILLVLRKLPRSVQGLSLLILFLATIFILAAYASYLGNSRVYSLNLMITAHFLCYTASLVVAFWLGGSYASTVVTPSKT